MISPLFNYLLIPFITALFLAINMGGSGTGPSFSTAYGARIIKLSVIPGLFGIMVFLGAIFAGKSTAETLGRGLLNPDLMSFTMVTIILFSVSISLLVANLSGIPQSTSQSTVLAIVAPATYFHQLNREKLFLDIIPTWFILPLVSFAICFLLGKYIYTPLRRRGYTISKKVNENFLLKGLILAMCCYVAFSIGANNVANAAGPIATMTMNELNLKGEHNFVFIMILSTLIVAPSFGIGSSLFGHKIVQKTGKEIFMFGRIEAVIIAFVSATLLLLASVVKGIPTSLVQLNVGAIIGIGTAKLGINHIFRKTQVRQFFAMWVIAPVISFSLSFMLTWLADYLGYL